MSLWYPRQTYSCCFHSKYMSLVWRHGFCTLFIAFSGHFLFFLFLFFFFLLIRFFFLLLFLCLFPLAPASVLSYIRPWYPRQAYSCCFRSKYISLVWRHGFCTQLYLRYVLDKRKQPIVYTVHTVRAVHTVLTVHMLVS
jgi:hypothetical protein